MMESRTNRFYILSSAAPKSWCEWIGDTSDSLGKYSVAKVLNTEELDKYEVRACSQNHFYFEPWPPPIRMKIEINSDWRLPDLLECNYYVNYVFSEKMVKALMTEKVTGIEFQEVEVIRIKKPKRHIKPRYYAPIVKNFNVKVKEERGIKYKKCKECGLEFYETLVHPKTKKDLFCYNGLIIDEKTWDHSDFFSTQPPPGPWGNIFVSQRVFDILIQKKGDKYIPNFTNVSLCPSELYGVEEYKKSLLRGT